MRLCSYLNNSACDEFTSHACVHSPTGAAQMNKIGEIHILGDQVEDIKGQCDQGGGRGQMSSHGFSGQRDAKMIRQGTERDSILLIS